MKMNVTQMKRSYNLEFLKGINWILDKSSSKNGVFCRKKWPLASSNISMIED